MTDAFQRTDLRRRLVIAGDRQPRRAAAISHDEYRRTLVNALVALLVDDRFGGMLDALIVAVAPPEEAALRFAVDKAERRERRRLALRLNRLLAVRGC